MSHRCPTCGFGCRTFNDQHRHRCEMVLKESLRIAVEALEFYADGRHLDVPDFKNNLTETEVIDDGDVARNALANMCLPKF